jgi:acyl carrier protein
MDALIAQIKDIFELDQVVETDVLRNYDLWDSLSVISLLAFIDSEWDLSLEADDLAGITTVGELWRFIEVGAAGRAK